MADELEHGLGDYLLAAQAERIRELEAALKAMVDRWEPDCVGTDRAMWEAARAALAKARETKP